MVRMTIAARQWSVGRCRLGVGGALTYGCDPAAADAANRRRCRRPPDGAAAARLLAADRGAALLMLRA